MLHGCCSGVSQSHELGSQERLEWLKFECWTKVTHWSPCPALAMCLSMLLYHRHEAALSVWLLQLILCRFCQAWLRPQFSLTRKAWASGELWFEILWEAGGLSWHAGARLDCPEEVCLDLPKNQYLPDYCCSPSNKVQISEVSAFSKLGWVLPTKQRFKQYKCCIEGA